MQRRDFYFHVFLNLLRNIFGRDGSSKLTSFKDTTIMSTTLKRNHFYEGVEGLGYYYTAKG